VVIIDDNDYEDTEEFYVNLTTLDPTVSLSPHFTVIAIDNDESKYYIPRNDLLIFTYGS